MRIIAFLQPIPLFPIIAVSYESFLTAADIDAWSAGVEQNGSQVEVESDIPVYATHDFDEGTYKISFVYDDRDGGEPRFAISTNPNPSITASHLYEGSGDGNVEATFDLPNDTVVYFISL